LRFVAHSKRPMLMKSVLAAKLLAHADPSPEPKGGMSRLVRLHGPGRQLSLPIEVPLRPELVRVLAKHGAIVIAVPDVRYTCGSFRDEHAFVLVVVRGVRYPKR
jgi:hypothetical protein